MKKLIKKMLNSLYLNSLSGSKRENIIELRNSFNALQIKDCNVATTEETWKKKSNRLIELGLNANPQKFLHWDVIRASMFVGNSDYIEKELTFLISTSDWGSRWNKAIKESPVGSPERYTHFPASSGNLIHHAYHLAKFEEKTKTKINEFDSVFEFGGGYGSMGRLFHNLGFQGKYIIFDLPSYSALQKYYLKSLSIPVNLNISNSHRSEIFCLSDYQELKETIKVIDLSNSLFIGTWSISETPLETRNIILPIALSCKYLLFAYSKQYEKINNQRYFDEWVEKNSNFDWISWPIDHIPGNIYLVGKPSM